MTNDDRGRPATIAEPVRRLIDGANYAHLATLLPNGAPHSVPMWVGMENGRIAVMTSPNSRKARNLERDPRVALSITDHDRPLVMATVRGRVFQGDFTQYHLDWDERTLVVRGVTTDPVDEGSTVYLTVEPRHCVLLEG